VTDDLSKQVAIVQADLAHYRDKSIADDSRIDMLKQQNARQASEIAKMAADHADQIRAMRQRCDLAVAREREISGGLHTAARGIMKCLQRLASDAVPEYAREPDGVVATVTDVSEIKDGTAGVRQLMTKLPPQVAFSSDRG